MTAEIEEFRAKADEAFTQIKSLLPEMEKAKEEDTARYQSLKAKVDELGAEVSKNKEAEAKAERDAEFEALKARVNDMMSSTHAASKAGAIVSEPKDDRSGEPLVESFFRSLAAAQSPRTPPAERARAEKALLDMGSYWSDVPAASKATLGATDADGGYIAPRAVVAEFTTVGVATNPYRSLLTVVTNILGPTVEIPHVGLAPTRAAVVARGNTKTNVGVSLTNYTATFYTLAQIHDAANQWLRQTRGAGERLIRQRLGEAMGLGESYYILQGSGTSEPKGILTSIGTSGTFVTTHTASQTTIAGNIATGIAKASGALADRSRTPTGVVMNAGNFWTALASGADTAGFFINPTGGASDVNAVGAFSNGTPAIRLWGLPVYADPNMPSDSAVIGAWNQAELYLGDGYRVDTSTEAGDRWDKNLTGFRAEEEIAFNADPYVQSGNFQRLIDTVA
jgi:HK97 family phage major capsid protein